jgi:hypothetical protein
MDQSQVKEGNASENASESVPPQPPKKKMKTEDKRLDRAFELLTACSNQALDDDCQHFGDVIAVKLRNYNDTLRCEGRRERTQKLEIRTSHKSKKETLLKTRVNPCPHSHQKRKQKISVSIGRLNY